MDNNVLISGKEALSGIGIIFGGLFGILFTVITLFWFFDTALYSSEYIHYDGVVVEADVVESYTATSTRRRKKSSGGYTTTTSTSTRYRQDLVVAYNSTETSLEDISTDKEGYSVNDPISIYVSKNNSNDVKVHADVSEDKSGYDLMIFLGVYWIVYIILVKRVKNSFKII